MLQLAGGDPYVRLLRYDDARRAFLLERLGQPLASAGDLLDELIAAQLVEVTGADGPATPFVTAAVPPSNASAPTPGSQESAYR